MIKFLTILFFIHESFLYFQLKLTIIKRSKKGKHPNCCDHHDGVGLVQPLHFEHIFYGVIPQNAQQY